jgi:hypothetical protein
MPPDLKSKRPESAGTWPLRQRFFTDKSDFCGEILFEFASMLTKAANRAGFAYAVSKKAQDAILVNADGMRASQDLSLERSNPTASPPARTASKTRFRTFSS